MIGVVASTFAGLLFNVIAEPLFSYFYTSVLLGAPSQAALALASWNAVTTITNAVIAIVISSALQVYNENTDSGLVQVSPNGLLDKLHTVKKD